MMFAVVVMAGCKKDKDETSKFEGTYKGTYTGGDKGSLIVDVDASGNISGTSLSSNTLEAFGITGKVDNNGSFTGSTDIGTEFKGAFSGSNASGTYSNTSLSISGNWTATKQ